MRHESCVRWMIRVAACLGLMVGAAGAESEVPVAQPAVASVQPDDSITNVVAVLGKPQGMITRGAITTYYYGRGLVHFRNGRVVSSTLVSPEEAERQREARERAEAAAREQSAAERIRLTEEGRNALTRHNEDKTFTGKAPAEQLAFWRDFAQRYPYTDVAAELAQAQAAVNAISGKDKQSAEIAALKERIAAIQARQAQLDADYAVSLANWKRNEINAERARLKDEMDAALIKIVTLQGQGTGNTN